MKYAAYKIWLEQYSRKTHSVLAYAALVGVLEAFTLCEAAWLIQRFQPWALFRASMSGAAVLPAILYLVTAGAWCVKFESDGKKTRRIRIAMAFLGIPVMVGTAWILAPYVDVMVDEVLGSVFGHLAGAAGRG